MSVPTAQRTPDYLVIGHIARDLTPNGVQSGGTALYSGLTAQRLGLQSAVVTSHSPDASPTLEELQSQGVWVASKPSPQTTTFTNTYNTLGVRSQILSARASPLTLADIPTPWLAAPIVHLAPIAQELSPHLPTYFSQSILGVTPQGWMRAWDKNGTVSQTPTPIPLPLTLLPPDTILVLSREDLAFRPDLIKTYAFLSNTLVLTNGPSPAAIFNGGLEIAQVPTYPANPIDPTGAGDVFAAALFIRYNETRDLTLSTTFAHAAASLAIAAPGTGAIPDRSLIEKLITGT